MGERYPAGYVPGDAFVEAELAEDAEGGGESAFKVLPFGVFVAEDWWAGEVAEVGWCGRGDGRFTIYGVVAFGRDGGVGYCSHDGVCGG
jgi:hypothetical protein